MRTTLDLPDPIFRALKARAALRGMKLKELLNEMIVAGLNMTTTESTTVKRSALPVARPATGKYVIPARSNAELQSLLDQEDATLNANH